MKEIKDYSHIKGWGIDADPKNEPTYPMKKYTGDDHRRIHWDRPRLQNVDVEILRSNERPNMSAVFGNTLPPKGLSGMIRRYAFKHSENRYRHWLPLLLADRINVVEGLMDDLGKGRVPNVFAEKGYRALWKHQPGQLIVKAIKILAITSCIVLAVKASTQRKRI
jgi:hypothetical protein